MKAFMLGLAVLASSTCFAQSTVKTTYEDGSLKSEYVKQGSDLVAVTNYYRMGAIKETGYFKNEIPEGKWETFSEDGTKTAELNYSKGKRHGEFRVWDEFSNTYLEMNYVNGDVIVANRYVKQTEFAVRDK